MDLGLSRTLRKEDGRRDRDRALPAPQLYLVIEADRPFAGGTRHSLAEVDDVTIGRGPRRTASRRIDGGIRRLSLQVPDARISTAHARIVRRGSVVTVHDLGSTNGTAVQGVASREATLADGDVLELGNTFFLYRAAAPVAAADPMDVDAADACARGALLTLVPALLARLADLERVATSTVAVALEGETGVGKELVARAVHAASGRRGPMVAVNCGAIPRTLVESELFGHRRGAFSGATEDRTGLVAAADGGTLFLDEIGDLAPESQAALLRVLQESEVTPVGATRPVPVDLRVVSATHHDLDELVAAGRFREDLAARLWGFRVEIPPVRARREDLGILIAAILRDLGVERALTARAAAACLAYAWPRNVRELRSRLQAAAALNAGPIDDVDLDLGEAVGDAAGADEPGDERRAELEALLREHRGNVSAVARALGKARTQVQRWLRRYRLDPERYR